MKNGQLKIEKGIPVPARRGREKTAARIAIEKLKKGESVLVPDGNIQSLSATACKILGVGNYALRTQPDGVRVWRIA